MSAERGHQATSGSAIFLKNMFLGNSFHYVLNDVVGKLLFCSIVCFDENSSSMLRHSLIGNLPSRAEIYFGCRVASARDLLTAQCSPNILRVKYRDMMGSFVKISVEYLFCLSRRFALFPGSEPELCCSANGYKCNK